MAVAVAAGETDFAKLRHWDREMEAA